VAMMLYYEIYFFSGYSRMADINESVVVGWREWLSLPEFGVVAIKAKIDTGARTSAIHAFSIEPFEREGESWVRFGMHPNQHESETEIWCVSKILEQRNVIDSGGHTEQRYVIKTDVTLGESTWAIEATLTNRDSMLFRMLLGRTAMSSGNIIVDPALSYLARQRNSTNIQDPLKETLEGETE